ncbi:hypothetical protein [Trebonia sp.]|uniref:hypothetical protein n=1 Tax=Trebonia sp. TaxID=2767075 RepID=UPI00263060E5|nr:hypothetical protein [Trebonia sp.]
MVSSGSGQVADSDAAAQQAAEVAVELTEADQLHDRRRLAIALNGVARTASRVFGRGTGIAKRGTDAAKRGTDVAARRGTGAARRGAEAARRGAWTARQRAGTAGRGAASFISWLATQVVAMGPRLAIRDQATLRAQFPGRSDDEIADLLIERAARAAAAVGGATGAWAALPVLPAFPAEVAAETLAVVGIEIKLVAELHEAYGVPAAGTATDRARAYIGAWAHRRGFFMVPGGLLLVAGSPLARQLRRRLAARVRRSTFSLSPLFTGALAGAMLNRRDTRKLGADIREDLRRRPVVSAERISGRPLTDPRD